MVEKQLYQRGRCWHFELATQGGKQEQ